MPCRPSSLLKCTVLVPLQSVGSRKVDDMSTTKANFPVRVQNVPSVSIHGGNSLQLRGELREGTLVVCVIGPRGGFIGEAYVDGKTLANALAYFGYEADRAPSLPPLVRD